MNGVTDSGRGAGFRETLRVAWMSAPGRTRQAIAGIWVLAGALIAVQIVFDFEGLGVPLEVVEAAGVVLASLGMAILATVLLLQAAQQREMGVARSAFAETRVPTQVVLVLPLVAAVGAVAVAIAMGMIASRALLGSPEHFVAVAVMAIYLGVVSRIIFGATRTLYEYGRRQAAAAERARGEAVQATMAALQAQTSPHFLFNTLNTVAALVRSDPRAAERTVESLASLLRRTLERSRRTMSTVADEMEYANAYLAIEQERFGERLRTEWQVPPSVRSNEIPTMTLQPLVENAIRHGISARLEGGAIRIAMEERPGGLLIVVEDTGPGFPSRHIEGNGLGNLRRRLTTLYGDAAGLRIGHRERGGGARVELVIPVVNATAPA